MQAYGSFVSVLATLTERSTISSFSYIGEVKQ